MSKKAVLSVALSDESARLYSGLSGEKAKNPPFEPESESEPEELRAFCACMAQLKEDMNRLSFMMSEIRDVLEATSSTRRFPA